MAECAWRSAICQVVVNEKLVTAFPQGINLCSAEGILMLPCRYSPGVFNVRDDYSIRRITRAL
jgi:hypothetical protein